MPTLLFLVEFLADLYMQGESTFTIEQEEKLTNVIVNHESHVLSPEATKEFEKIYDDWETTCEKNPYDPSIGGW